MNHNWKYSVFNVFLKLLFYVTKSINSISIVLIAVVYIFSWDELNYLTPFNRTIQKQNIFKWLAKLTCLKTQLLSIWVRCFTWQLNLTGSASVIKTNRLFFSKMPQFHCNISIQRNYISHLIRFWWTCFNARHTR